MPSDNPPRRRFASKSRGICGTCRARHVRCDQQKPRCTPCQKSSRHCEYSADSASLAAEQLKVVIWQPSEASLMQVPQAPWKQPEEGRALRYFRDVVAERLAGSFDASFWNRMALQTAQTVSPVRHAMVALASLWETAFEAGLDISATEQPNIFALRQYSTAVSEMRQSLQGTCSPSREEILMSNVLFICIEMLQGHHESAIGQLSSGLYMFCDWQANQRVQYSSAASQTAKSCNEFETHLNHVFRRLIMQRLLFPDTHSVDKRMLTPAFTPVMPPMPAFFNSIEEARDLFNDCMSSMIHGSLAIHFQGSEENATSDSNARPLFQLHGNTLKEWFEVFETFVKTAGVELSAKEQRGCVLLEIQYIAMSILASNMSLRSETAFDACESEFVRLVALARSVSNGSAPAPHDGVIFYPSLDIGLLPPLYFAASRCRHPVIRRQAVVLLRQGTRQEGIWNSVMFSNLAELIISIEEGGCKNVREAEDIPAAARITLLDATIRSSTQRVDVIFGRKVHNSENDIEFLHETIEY